MCRDNLKSDLKISNTNGEYDSAFSSIFRSL